MTYGKWQKKNQKLHQKSFITIIFLRQGSVIPNNALAQSMEFHTTLNKSQTWF